MVLVSRRGVAANPAARDRLALVHIALRVMLYLRRCARSGFLAGQEPGPSQSVFKPCWSQHQRRITEPAVNILSADATVPGERPPTGSLRADLPGSPNISAS